MSAGLDFHADVNGFQASRCTFRCVRCERTGSRVETFRTRQPTLADASHFYDQCPNCGSKDVEVSAPTYRHGAALHHG